MHSERCEFLEFSTTKEKQYSNNNRVDMQRVLTTSLNISDVISSIMSKGSQS